MTALAAIATDAEVRHALIASLRERIGIAVMHVGLDSPEAHHERLAVLRFGLESALDRGTEELKRLNESARKLVEDVSHVRTPYADLCAMEAWKNQQLAGRISEREATAKAVDLAIRQPRDGACARHLSDADCDARCCHMCDREDRLGGDRLCGSCLTDLAMDRLEEQYSPPGSRCGAGCAWCGRCS